MIVILLSAHQVWLHHCVYIHTSVCTLVYVTASPAACEAITPGGMRAVPRLCIVDPGICITTEIKSRKTLSKGIRKALG